MPLSEYASLNESHAMNAFVAQETLDGLNARKSNGDGDDDNVLKPLQCDIVENMLYSDLFKMHFRFYSPRRYVPRAAAAAVAPKKEKGGEEKR